MKIGVLESGPVVAPLVPAYGEYGDIFERYLGAYDESLSFQPYAAHLGEIPKSPEEADAWIISGSRYGVYDDEAFIEPLKAFIQAAAKARRPMIGVCFGHQIMAEALGGRAEKFEGGWGLGRHEYEVRNMPDWAPETPERLAIHAVHQDQVTQVPADATTVAGSSFCQNAALLYGDPDAPYALSIQPHPEFDDGFVGGVIDVRRNGLDPKLCEQAEATMGQKLHRDWAANWFLSFLKAALPKK